MQTAWDTIDSCRVGRVATTLDRSSRVDCGGYESVLVLLDQRCWNHEPGCSQHVHAVQSFGAIHLGQHLVHDAVRNSRRVVASARKKVRKRRQHSLILRCWMTKDLPLGSNTVKLVKEQHARFGGRRTVKKVSHLQKLRKKKNSAPEQANDRLKDWDARSSHSLQCTCSRSPGP